MVKINQSGMNMKGMDDPSFIKPMHKIMKKTPRKYDKVKAQRTKIGNIAKKVVGGQYSK